MKWVLARAAIAALGMVALPGAAGATPFYFDFSGVIDAGSPDAPAIAGGFTFETERLYEPSLPVPTQRQWVDWQPTNLSEPLAYLNFGGQSVTFPAGTGTNYGLISFVDACDASGCQPNSVENFSMFVSATDQPMPADFTGTARNTSFYFSSAAYTRLPDFPYVQPFDYFDLAQVDPTWIVSLPLHEMFGTFSETTWNCVAGNCEATDSRSFGFTVDTVTRGMGPRSVPEPGTFGLLAFALVALLISSRRRKARASLR